MNPSNNKVSQNFSNNEYMITISSNGFSLDIKEPFCLIINSYEHKDIRKLYNYLKTFADSNIFILNNEFLCLYQKQLIIIDVRSRSLDRTQRIKVQTTIVDSSKGAQYNLKSGFKSKYLDENSNSIGMVVAILKNQNKNGFYTRIFTCYMAAFNMAIIMVDQQLQLKGNLQRIFVLVPNFVDQVQRNTNPYELYGQVTNLYHLPAYQNILLLQINPKSQIFSKIGYLPLQFNRRIDCTLYYYEQMVGEEESVFWKYRIFKKKDTNQGVYNGRIILPPSLENQIKKLSLDLCSSKHLTSQLQYFYKELQSINLQIINQSYNTDNNYREGNQLSFARKRQQIYYRLWQYESDYQSELRAFNKSQLSGTEKELHLFCFCQRSVSELANRIDRSLFLNRNNVRRQTSNTFSLSSVLFGQRQYSQHQIINYLHILIQKKLFFEYNMLSLFYQLFSLELFEKDLSKRMRLDLFINIKEEIIPITQTKQISNQILKLEVSKNNSFKLYPMVEFSLKYEDDSYQYKLEYNGFQQQQISSILNREGLNGPTLSNLKDAFLDSGFIIIDQNKGIQLKRYWKPQYKKNDHTKLFRRIQEKQLINKMVKQQIKNQWSSFSCNLSSEQNSIYFEVKVFFFIENKQSKKRSFCQSTKGYLIGVNGFMFKSFANLSDDEQIISSCCFTDGSTQPKKVTEIICKRKGERIGFSVALLQTPQDINYHGLRGSITDPSDQNNQSDISFENHYDRPPSISIGNQALFMEIKKCLSMLSNFQIISQSIILPIMLQKVERLKTEYESRQQFERYYENQQNFANALNIQTNFFSRRIKAIKNYQRSLQIQQQISNDIINYKRFNIDIEQIMKQQMMSKLSQLLHFNQRIPAFEEKCNIFLRDVNEDIKQQITSIRIMRKQYLDKHYYVQAQLLLKHLQDLINAKSSQQIDQLLFLTHKKDYSLKKTSNDIDFYENYTQFKLPKLVFHPCLNESESNRINLSNQIKQKQCLIQEAFNQLMQNDQLEYERVVDQILNAPISDSQKYKNLQLMFEFYQLQNIQKDLSSKQYYMKYLFEMFKALRIQNRHFRYYLIDDDTVQKQATNCLTKNSIKTKLTIMGLINNFSTKQTVKSYIINHSLPEHEEKTIKNRQPYIIEQYPQISQRLANQQLAIQRISFRQKRQNKKIQIFIKSTQNIQTILRQIIRNRIQTSVTKTRACKAFLSLNNFDWQFNYQYSKLKTSLDSFKQIQYRGGLPFYQASQCHKLALKSLGVYSNDLWLSKFWNPQAYALAYHGVSIPLQDIHPEVDLQTQQTQQTTQPHNVVQNIIDSGLRPGHRHLYSNTRCQMHENQLISSQPSIYLTPSFKTAIRYASQNQRGMDISSSFAEDESLIDSFTFSSQKTKKAMKEKLQEMKRKSLQSKKYYVIFMNRVKPQDICIAYRNKEVNVPENQRNLYWLVKKKQSCRTYAVVLIDQDTARRYPNMNDQFGQTFTCQKYKGPFKRWLVNRIRYNFPQLVPPRQNNNNTVIRRQERNICNIY